jgi:phosphoribosylformylglycinamidine synthase subunit PurS
VTDLLNEASQAMHAIVTVMLKNGVLDPQGKAVEGALAGAGFAAVKGVRIGKSIVLDLGATPQSDAGPMVEAMCRSLLVNAVIESFTYELKPN